MRVIQRAIAVDLVPGHLSRDQLWPFYFYREKFKTYLRYRIWKSMNLTS